MSFWRTLGRVKVTRGKETERKFFSSLSNSLSLPPWIVRVEAASRADDKKGIDAIVYTDIGKLFVQIKSSFAGKRKFEQRRRSLPIAVVVISPGEEESSVRNKVVEALSYQRERLLSNRSRS